MTKITRAKIEEAEVVDITDMPLSEVIIILTALMDKGFEYLEKDAYEAWGCIESTIKAVRHRMETDEELARRQAIYEANEKRELKEYKRLKAKFDPGQ